MFDDMRKIAKQVGEREQSGVLGTYTHRSLNEEFYFGRYDSAVFGDDAEEARGQRLASISQPLARSGQPLARVGQPLAKFSQTLAAQNVLIAVTFLFYRKKHDQKNTTGEL